MRVLIISANRFAEPYPVFPLGAEYVAAAVAAKHEVQILDLNPTEDNAPIGAAIQAFAPDVIGLSLRNIDNTDATDVAGFVGQYREVVAAIRTASDAPLVLGGGGFTIFPAALMRELGADYGVVGEGERLAPLLEALQRGEDPAALVPGVVDRACPAEVPFPAPWEGAPARALAAAAPILDHYLERGGILNLQTSRGCPHRCVYCTYPSIEGRTPRRFDPGEVGAAARQLQDAGARFLFVTDAVFNTAAEHGLTVAAALAAAGVSIPWAAYFSPTPVPQGYYQRLAEVGLTHVEFGTEALCDATLRSYRKPFNTEQVFAAHEAALAAGLHVAHFYVLGGPGETEQTLQQTLDNADRLEHCVHFFFCGMRIYPGTELRSIALEQGQIDADDDLLEPIFYVAPDLHGIDIAARVEAYAQRRMNWVIGAGSERLLKLQMLMYRKGHTGPLWELLIR